MNLKRLATFFLVFSLLSIALAAPKEVSDDVIYDTVRRRLASDPVVKGGAIQVAVAAGVVTLKGGVETEKQRVRAEKMAKKTPGVKNVKNELQVTRK